MISSICVFCGSSMGARPEYRASAEALGREIARRGLRLVYGGGNIGTMGALARSALAAGGEVLGVIPRRLYELVDHGTLEDFDQLFELVVADGMHERKSRMAESSDAFIALPGGTGTLEELFEVWTWRHIGFHAKPVGILDVAGFYRPLLDFLAQASREGFIKSASIEDLVVEEDPGRLIDRLEKAGPPTELKLPERQRD